VGEKPIEQTYWPGLWLAEVMGSNLKRKKKT
jgi:hypothetical protein